MDCILGPLILLLYINNRYTCFFDYLIFADDSILYRIIARFRIYSESIL